MESESLQLRALQAAYDTIGNPNTTDEKKIEAVGDAKDALTLLIDNQISIALQQNIGINITVGSINLLKTIKDGTS